MAAYQIPYKIAYLLNLPLLKIRYLLDLSRAPSRLAVLINRHLHQIIRPIRITRLLTRLPVRILPTAALHLLRQRLQPLSIRRIQVPARLLVRILHRQAYLATSHRQHLDEHPRMPFDDIGRVSHPARLAQVGYMHQALGLLAEALQAHKTPELHYARHSAFVDLPNHRIAFRVVCLLLRVPALITTL